MKKSFKLLVTIISICLIIATIPFNAFAVTPAYQLLSIYTEIENVTLSNGIFTFNEPNMYNDIISFTANADLSEDLVIDIECTDFANLAKRGHYVPLVFNMQVLGYDLNETIENPLHTRIYLCDKETNELIDVAKKEYEITSESSSYPLDTIICRTHPNSTIRIVIEKNTFYFGTTRLKIEGPAVGNIMGGLPMHGGDLNFDHSFNMADVLILRKLLAGWYNNENQSNLKSIRERADVNWDDKCTMADVLLLRKYIAKWDVELL